MFVFLQIYCTNMKLENTNKWIIKIWHIQTMTHTDISTSPLWQ